MRTLVHAGAPDAPHRLLALLPGSYSEPEDFMRHGFVEAAVSHRIADEIVAVELRAAWFADGSIVERLVEHLVRPARARGYEQVAIAGISIGALSALAFAARHESDVESLVLIAPYPCARDVLR